MRTIWKYSVTDWHGEISMPRGAKIVHVAMQDNIVTLWAEVDTNADQVARGFGVLGTGHRLPDEYGSYIGTVPQGPYVWHLYLEDEPPTRGVRSETRSVDNLRAHLFDELQVIGSGGMVEASDERVFVHAADLLRFLREVASK